MMNALFSPNDQYDGCLSDECRMRWLQLGCFVSVAHNAAVGNRFQRIDRLSKLAGCFYAPLAECRDQRRRLIADLIRGFAPYHQFTFVPLVST
jgi:hypothetical protein